jgi:import inner membrane translocase subunit TIM21
MASIKLLSQTRYSANFVRLCTKSRSAAHVVGFKRKYATHRSSMDFGEKSQLLESLDTKQQRSDHKHDNVGPFQLGLSQAARKGEPIKKWSELSTGGKGACVSFLDSDAAPIFRCALLSILYSRPYNGSYNKFGCHSPWSWAFSTADLFPHLRTVLQKFSDGVIWGRM